MKFVFLIFIILYFPPNKVFGKMYDLNTDKEINQTMKWDCPGGDFSWSYSDNTLKEDEKSSKGREIYEWIPPHYKINGIKKIIPGRMKINTSDKDTNFIVESLKWERLDNDYFGTALLKNVMGINGIISVVIHFNGKNIFANFLALDTYGSKPFGYFSTGKCNLIS